MPKQPIYLVSLLLLIGAAPLPYGYYLFLRIVACVFFIWAAITSHEKENLTLPWVFALLAILFNPIMPIHFPKMIWAVIDVSAAILVLCNHKNLVSNQHAPNK